MATFNPGQRVKVIAGQFVGMTGTLTSHLHHDDNEALIGVTWIPWPEVCYEIQLDSYLLNDGADYSTVLPEEIEPIQHERNKATEWSACAWQPEHLRERVS